MAFTKKFVKKKAEPARATSYARKKKEEVEEVVEEVEEIETEQEEAVDDTDYEQEDAPAAPAAPARRTGYAPQRAHAPSRSPQWQAQGQGQQGERQALRLTGLFAGKREGLFSGRLRDEDAAKLADLIAEAQSSGQQVSFFLWENQAQQGKPLFSLTANIAAPSKGGFKGRPNRGQGFGYQRGGSYR